MKAPQTKTFEIWKAFAICVAFAITACNFQGTNSSLDDTFRPGLPIAGQSFTQNIPYNSSQSNSLSFDSSKIQLTGTSSELHSVVTNDADNSFNGFGSAGLVGAFWDPQLNYLRLTNNGGCDSSLSDCNGDDELSSLWTPDYSNLRAYFKMDGALGVINSGATIVDTTGLSNGTTSGTGLAYVGGKISQGLSFDGSHNVSIPHTAPANLCSNFTVSTWMKADPSNLSSYERLLSNWNGYAGDSAWALGQDGGSEGLSVSINTTGAFNQVYGTGPAVFDGKWHHTAFTLSSSGTLLVYIDGAQVINTGVNFGTGVCSPTAPLQMGAGGCANNFVGTLDETAIWNTVLGPADIAAIYNHQRTEHVGVVTSRALDALDSGQKWSQLSWVPTLPSYKFLPENGSSETSYSSETANLMTGIIGLWHLNEPANTSGSGSVKDRSGQNPANNGTPTSVTFGSPSPFGSSASFNSSANIALSSTTLPLGTSNRTLSVWMSPASVGNQSVVSYGVHSNSELFEIDIYNGNVICHWDGGFIVGAPAALGKWTHAVCSYDGSTVKLYQDQVMTGYQATTLSTTATTFYIGAGFLSPFSGSIADVAIWNRVLGDGTNGSENEIQELFRRGSNGIKYQVRTCSDSNCANSPSSWTGPDGTTQSYFSEANNTLTNLIGATVQLDLPSILFDQFTALTVPNNRYLQYRAILESTDNGSSCNYGASDTWCSPELKSVTLGPKHFENSSPSITTVNGISFKTLTSFSEILGSDSCPSGTTYSISPDGIHFFYYNPSTEMWSAANGQLAQTTSASVINSNLPTFSVQAGIGNLYVKAFLNSDGTKDCQLQAVSISGTQ